MNAIVAEGVKPTLAELEKFEEAPEGIAIELGQHHKSCFRRDSFLKDEICYALDNKM